MVYANQHNNFGRTALSYAADPKSEGIVRILLSKDMLDINKRDVARLSTLNHTIQNGRENVIKLLMDSQIIEVRANNSNRISPLIRGREGDYRMKLFCKAMASLNTHHYRAHYRHGSFILVPLVKHQCHNFRDSSPWRDSRQLALLPFLSNVILIIRL